jgi:hypothetical protein
MHFKSMVSGIYVDLLTVNAGVRGFASRSQENLVDAMSKERFQKSFSTRGQSSTLPLNCRPPSTQRRSSTFRNMFNKFRRSKNPSPSTKTYVFAYPFREKFSLHITISMNDFSLEVHCMHKHKSLISSFVNFRQTDRDVDERDSRISSR